VTRKEYSFAQEILAHIRASASFIKILAIDINLPLCLVILPNMDVAHGTRRAFNRSNWCLSDQVVARANCQRWMDVGLRDKLGTCWRLVQGRRRVLTLPVIKHAAAQNLSMQICRLLPQFSSVKAAAQSTTFNTSRLTLCQETPSHKNISRTYITKIYEIWTGTPDYFSGVTNSWLQIAIYVFITSMNREAI
jgi:hypothetical protein